MTKNYELAYLANPDLSEEELEELSKRITDFITSQSGIILKTQKNEKRRLGYELKEKKDAFLGSIEFSFSAADKAPLLKKMADADKNILRSLLVIKPEEKEVEQKETGLKENPKSKKVELDKIDEKIDEILK